MLTVFVGKNLGKVVQHSQSVPHVCKRACL